VEVWPKWLEKSNTSPSPLASLCCFSLSLSSSSSSSFSSSFARLCASFCHSRTLPSPWLLRIRIAECNKTRHRGQRALGLLSRFCFAFAINRKTSLTEQRRFASSVVDVFFLSNTSSLLYINAPLPRPRRPGSAREHRLDELDTGDGAAARHAAAAGAASGPPHHSQNRRSSKPRRAASASATAGLHHQLPLPQAEHARLRRRAIVDHVRH